MTSVIYDVMPNSKIESTVFDLDSSDYWHGVGIDRNTEAGCYRKCHHLSYPVKCNVERSRSFFFNAMNM